MCELPLRNAVSDYRLDRSEDAGEDSLREPVMDRAVLRPMEDVDELAFVRLGADLADGPPESEQAVDWGETRRGRGRLDDLRDTIYDPLGDRVDRVVLRLEVQIEGALRDTRGLDDVVHR